LSQNSTEDIKKTGQGEKDYGRKIRFNMSYCHVNLHEKKFTKKIFVKASSARQCRGRKNYTKSLPKLIGYFQKRSSNPVNEGNRGKKKRETLSRPKSGERG